MSSLSDLKKQLKKWESTFFAEHSRKPNKTDIDAASENIRSIYEQYSKLKRKATDEQHKAQEEKEDISKGCDLSKCKTDDKNEEKSWNKPDSSRSGGKPSSSGSCWNKPVSSKSSKSSPTMTETLICSEFDETDGDSICNTTPEDIWGPALNKDISISESDGRKEKGEKELKSSKLLDKLGQKLFKNEQKLSVPERSTSFGSKRNNWSKRKEDTACLKSETNMKSSATFTTSSDVHDCDKYPMNTSVSDHDSTEMNQSEHFAHKSDKPLENQGIDWSEYSKHGKTKDDNHSDNSIYKSSYKISSRLVSENKLQTSSDDVFIPKQFQLSAKPRLKFSKMPVASFEKMNAFDQDLDLEDRIREENTEFRTEEDLPIFTNTTICETNPIPCSKKPTGRRKANERIDTSDNVDEKITSSAESSSCKKLTSSYMESIICSKINKTNVDKTRKLETEKMLTVNKDDFSESSDVFDASNIDECDLEDEEKSTKKKSLTGKRKLARKAVPASKRLKKNPEEMEDENANKDVGVDDAEVVSKKSRPVSAAPRKKASFKGSSDNFVRLNMKIKRYQRKDGRHMSGPQLKRKQWKDKMKSRSKSYGDKCFICHKEGHWSRDCPDKTGRPMKQSEPVEENDFPSLLEAAGMSRGIKVPAVSKSNTGDDVNSDLPTDQAELIQVEMSVVRSHREDVVPPPSSQPYVTLQPDGEIPEKVPQIKAGLKMFGFSEFRPGQELTVKRILAGLSTLVVLSTGGGKSLCYQLPAYLYATRSKSLTIVVSPLVSLMEDQVTGLPDGVRGLCLHSNMTKAQREGVFAALNDGSVHFLLVSPEAVVGGGGMLNRSFPSPDKLPPISFVCIDEAHCLSEWSHNFRPSYLRLCKVLRDKYGVKCFLGLTATATKATAFDVSRHLGIVDIEEATIRGSPVPRNLVFSVSQDDNKDEAIMNLLQGDRFTECHSIIVYCTRREEANRVATLLRTCLQKPEMSLGVPMEKPVKAKKGRRKKSLDAESYHAGLTPAQRKRVQKNFMSGELRIVVATVAFGMGLDKSDVRAVIHYNMPKSFEGYVQEIGRAGRDGQTSHCHLFLDPEGKDLSELRRHTYSNSVDRYVIKRLIQKVFKKCRCQEIHGSQTKMDESSEPQTSASRDCPGHERALDIQKTVQELDIREEGISTLMCYLELHPYQWVENLQPVYATCKLQCYGGPAQLQAVAKKCPPVAVAIAKQKMDGTAFSNSNTIEFDVIEISDSMGWDSGPVKRELRLLQWNLQPGGASKTGVMVEFSDLAFHFRSPGDLMEDEIDGVIDFLHQRVTKQEKTELFQLNLLHNSLKSAAHRSYWMCCDEASMTKSDKLRCLIEDYFENEKSVETRMNEAEEEEMEDLSQHRDLDQLVLDIRQFVNLYGHEHSLNGRVIARIFHGIASPCFPSITWGRVRRFWRSHLHVNFNIVLKTATRELIGLR